MKEEVRRVERRRSAKPCGRGSQRDGVSMHRARASRVSLGLGPSPSQLGGRITVHETRPSLTLYSPYVPAVRLIYHVNSDLISLLVGVNYVFSP